MYTELKKELDQYHVALVAVSKTKPLEAIKKIYNQGQRIFGENRAQEMAQKHELLPKDIEWHMIGHLQKNKVKYISSFVKMVHSVDNVKLLSLINKEADKYDRSIDFLLQIKIAKEESKYGLSPKQGIELAEKIVDNNFPHTRCCGVMGMATFTENPDQIEKEFSFLRDYFKEMKSNIFGDRSSFNTISMGMSGDYKLAIKCGSNMVRIGSMIFGPRNYE
jgi:pyridoxal phosphate enzyme (YggS family)